MTPPKNVSDYAFADMERRGVSAMQMLLAGLPQPVHRQRAQTAYELHEIPENECMLSVTREEVESWLAWKATQAAQREDRRYWIMLSVAGVGALAAIAAAFEGLH
jgi:hypothetical protein